MKQNRLYSSKLSSTMIVSFTQLFILFTTLVVTSQGFNFYPPIDRIGQHTAERTILSNTENNSKDVTIPITTSLWVKRDSSNGEVLRWGGGDGRQRRTTFSNTRKVARYFVPISTAIVIGWFSALEIIERRNKLGHAHGMPFSAVIRLGRSMAILQTEAEEVHEQMEKIDETIGVRLHGTFLSRLGNWIASPFVTILACLFAALASIVEIMEDLKPGAHHGAALLALSELYYQVGRLLQQRRHRKRQQSDDTTTDTNGSSKKSSMNILRQLRSRIPPLGAVIALAAAAYAGIELRENFFKPGAHHAVAIMALAELIENINRSNVIH